MKKTIQLLPLITEKTSSQMEMNKYTFLLFDDVNKIEVKSYIEEAYDVKVLNVNMLKKKSKKKRRGRITGSTTERKKAVVTLESGSVIKELQEIL